MSKSKIEQNIERVSGYVFHTLGCGYEDVKEIFDGVLKKKAERDKEIKEHE